ncbi:hypothetical protein QE152_g781 [Popillia japonica]|uniref:Uncharacterized protein n=1 Tax=Popillia japonica TaxID=7064 RepID=A0AAW1NCJ3_POPJA
MISRYSPRWTITYGHGCMYPVLFVINKNTNTYKSSIFIEKEYVYTMFIAQLLKVRTDLSILLRTNRTSRARTAEPNKQSEKKLGIFVAVVLFAAFPCSSVSVRRG